MSKSNMFTYENYLKVHYVCGAFGCGVFKNNPVDIARWWHELLFDEGYGELFEIVYFSILDRTGGQVFSTFERILGGNMYK